MTDRVSGCSKGFGFVRYATTEEAAKGIEGMDGKVYGCLMLSVYFIFHRRCITVL